jgi:D-sedoheptulose 7-phosphate isomerase
MEKIIEAILNESLTVKKTFIMDNVASLIFLAEKIAFAFTNNHKLMLCGNGGSAADAQHIAAEFVNRFEIERPPLPAIALTTDTSIITSIGNDYSFDEIFSKQVKAIGTEGDILLAISTSGNSENILRAVKEARDYGIYTAGFLGKNGGRLLGLVDLPLVVNDATTARVQEAHILAAHILCYLVDYLIFQMHTKE